MIGFFRLFAVCYLQLKLIDKLTHIFFVAISLINLCNVKSTKYLYSGVISHSTSHGGPSMYKPGDPTQVSDYCNNIMNYEATV